MAGKRGTGPTAPGDRGSRAPGEPESKVRDSRTIHPTRNHPEAPCFIHLDVHAKFDQEVNRWIAGSKRLDVWSSGDDPKKALDRAEEAIFAFLNEAEEMGTIWEVLKDAGIRVQRKEARSPEPVFGRLLDAFKTEYSFPLAFRLRTPSQEHCAD